MCEKETTQRSKLMKLMALLAIFLMAGGCKFPWESAETTAAASEAAPAGNENAPAETTAPFTEPAETTTENKKNFVETMESFQAAFKKLDAEDLVTYEGKFQGVPALCFSTKDLCVELLLDVKSNAAGVIIAQDFGNGEWRSVVVPKGAAKREMSIQNINAFKYNPTLPHTGLNAFLGEARSCDVVQYIDGMTIEGRYELSDTTFKAYLVNDTITAISTAANYDVNIYPANLTDSDSFSTSVRILQDMSRKMAVMPVDELGYIESVAESVNRELNKLYTKLEQNVERHQADKWLTETL